jgi:flavin-dependent dehydrogenase
MQTSFDVVIGGGGLAGLTLARHLRRRNPEISVLVVDRAERPLPEAVFKVGESTVAVGGYYLQEVLGLRSYLEQRHILKLGLRYFFGGQGGRFSQRPELGPRQYRTSHLGDFPVPEWQVDRGRLENDLREMVQQDGVELLEGWRVDDVALAAPLHRIHCSRDDDRREIGARWFIDAMSRRFFLQRKLGLKRAIEPPHSAVWFRVKGSLAPGDFVPADDRAWHERVPGLHPTDPTYGRRNSTNHLLGPGYWVWLIPLASGHTSVGIVAREDMQAVAELRRIGDALAWLEQNEPEVARALVGREVCDFKRLRGYSHSCTRVLSADRWAMSGEAGCFIDPLYSPGTDAIAYMNSLICEAIRLERSGRLGQETAEALSRDYISWSELTTQGIQSGYPLFGHAVVGCVKLMWDFAVGQAVAQPAFFDLRLRPGFLDERASWPEDRLTQLRVQVGALSGAVTRLLHDWMPRARSGLSFEFIEPLDQNPVTRGRLQADDPAGAHPLDRWYAGLERLRRFAVAILLMAVEDVHPDRLRELTDAPAIEPSVMQLDPDTWQGAGLFRASGLPRTAWTTERDLLRSCFVASQRAT